MKVSLELGENIDLKELRLFRELLPLYEEITRELFQATAKFGPFHSPHEGYAVIKEELDELWEEVKRNDGPRQREEVIQLTAMGLRYLYDLCRAKES